MELRIRVCVGREGDWNQLEAIFTLENHGKETFYKMQKLGAFHFNVYLLGLKVQELRPRTYLDILMYLDLEPGEKWSWSYNYTNTHLRPWMFGTLSITRVYEPGRAAEIETSKVEIIASYYPKSP